MPVTQKYIPQESHFGTESLVSTSLLDTELVPSSEHANRLARLNNHVIEPELLGTNPRCPQRVILESEMPIYELVRLCHPLVYLLYSHNWAQGNPGKMLLVGIGAAFYIGFNRFAAVRVARYRQRIYSLLRHGVAVPAIVMQTNLGNGASEKADSVRLSFEYLNSLGGFASKTITIAMSQFQKFKLDEGDTFTLLMSHKDELDVLPYFQLGETYSLLATTTPPTTSSVSPSVKRGSVEQELLTSRPRRVRWEAAARQQWKWIAYLFLISIPLILASLKILFHFSPWSELPTALLAIILGATGIWTLRLLRSLSLLREGLSARASITGEEFTSYEGIPLTKKETHLVLVYQFETLSGKRITSKIRVPYRQAAELGLMMGTEFTVLYDAQSPQIHQPYFQFKLATIPGAENVCITPP